MNYLSSRFAPLALVALAVALATNVLLGPLGLNIIQWRVSDNGLNQTLGADGAILMLVVPTALVSAWLWRLRHRLAAPLALGTGLAALYYGVAEVLGGDYVRYAGNNERFFGLFLSVIILSWSTALVAWKALDATPPAPPRWLARSFGAVLLLAGGLIGFAWSAQLIAIALTGTVGPEYVDSPSAFWTIRIVDLGFIVPLAIWTGIGLWRGRPSAVNVAYALASFLVLQGVSVLTMGVVMLARQDPTASPALVYALAPICLALSMLTLFLLRSYATS